MNEEFEELHGKLEFRFSESAESEGDVLDSLADLLIDLQKRNSDADSAEVGNELA